MAMEQFIEITGVVGEASAPDVRGAIPVLSWSFGLSRPKARPVSGPADFSGFRFTKRVDSTTPLLLDLCARGASDQPGAAGRAQHRAPGSPGRRRPPRGGRGRGHAPASIPRSPTWSRRCSCASTGSGSAARSIDRRGTGRAGELVRLGRRRRTCPPRPASEPGPLEPAGRIGAGSGASRRGDEFLPCGRRVASRPCKASSSPTTRGPEPAACSATPTCGSSTWPPTRWRVRSSAWSARASGWCSSSTRRAGHPPPPGLGGRHGHPDRPRRRRRPPRS